MTHVTYRLTAKNRDQLRNPTLGNRVWAAFFIDIDIDIGATPAAAGAPIDPGRHPRWSPDRHTQPWRRQYWRD